MRAGPAFAAILEVLGVYVGGQLVMFGLAAALGIELRNPLIGHRQIGDLMLPAGLVMVVVAIGLEFREKRRG